MEDECSPLSWAFYYQEEGSVHQEEYLKHSLLYTTLELETTILSTREELARKDDELVHLNVLLKKMTKERDEAIAKCDKLTLENLFLHQQSATKIINEDAHHPHHNPHPHPQPHPHHDYYYHSSSESDENMIVNPHPHPLPSAPAVVELGEGDQEDENDQEIMERINFHVVSKKPLPEKGKFLQAVMEAGPLLQTLLLAGPLPQWQRPPPQLSSIDIPPVTISSSPSPRLVLHHQDSSEYCFSKKRTAAAVAAAVVNSTSTSTTTDPSCINSKYQKVVHQSSLTNNI